MMDDEIRRKMAPWMESSMLKPALRPSMLGLPLPLGLQAGNPFNLAKARADAAAASAAGSRASSYRSRRQSVGSQMSHISHSSKRSIRSGKSGRYGRAGKNFKGVEIVEPDIIQVFDEHGKDVTPKPLVSLRPTILHERLLQIPADRLTPESERPSVYSRTGYSMASSMGSFTPDTIDDEGAERDEGDMNAVKRGTTGPSKEMHFHHADSQRRIPLVHERVSVPTLEQDLEKPITVMLIESDTFDVINLRGYTLNNAYENVKEVLDRNSKYKKILQLKIGSDNYSDSSSQTLLSLQKYKEVQIPAKPTEAEACQANSWDIFDCSKRLQSGVNETLDSENKGISVTKGTTMDVADDASISSLLISAGYLEPSSAATTGATLPSNLRLAAGSIAGSRRGTLLGNVAGSQRGSGFGNFSVSRRGSTMGSVLPSRRGSVSGSVGGSRRGSTTGSLAPSRRGSTMGTLSLSRRGSKLANFAGEELPLRGSFVERQSTAAEDCVDALLLSEDDSLSQKQKVDLDSIAGLLTALEIAERALAQNTFHDKLLFYRDFRPRDADHVEDHGSLTENHLEDQLERDLAEVPSSRTLTMESGKRIEWLWDFCCDITEDRNISCVVWNKVSKDLLTVGYGQFEFGSQKDGLIAFWSLKNPCYPHATIATTSGVTALDFSVTNANLLAVGFYNGNVAVYDVRNPKDAEPTVQSGLSTGKHRDPVWKVQWIDSNSEHGESLVSISTDGRVTQWFLKKELEYVNLMTLKGVASNSKGAQPQPFISRRAAGMCFDFSPRDSSIYLVGTEEGRIHKCSRSYNEQYLQTYVGHTGPVFQVRWSTFVPYLFLSCSSDWTVRLWQEDRDSALLVFQSATDSLQDLRWSLTNACVFGTVSAAGRLEIWDLSLSAVKPVIVCKEDRKLSCLLFCQSSPIVISAGNNGAASTFRLVGFETEDTDAEEVQKLRKALSANINALPD